MRSGALAVPSAPGATPTGRKHRGELAALCCCLLPAALATTVVAVALSTPHGLYGLTQYDDGVYFGAALRLVAGALPYRDFTFVQPPGIAVVMAPVALLAHLLGTKGALAAARVITALVVGANAFGASYLVRHRGAAASAAAGLSLALFAPAFFADHTLLLEPYVIGFCLLGANLVFRSGALASPGRVLAGGIFFGLAGTVKLWAVVPFAALCISLLGRRHDLFRFVSGAGVAFVVLCLPFFAAAPGAFVHDVVRAQLARQTTSPRQPAVRLWGIVGLHGLSLHFTRTAHGRWAYGLAAILGALLALGLLVPLLARRGTRLEGYLLLSALSGVGLLFVPVEYFDHYTYFSAGFLAPALGSALGSGVTWCRGALAPRGIGWRAPGYGVLALLVAVGVFGAIRAARDETAYDRSYLAEDNLDVAAISAALPAGTCVVTDSASLTILADRFYTAKAGCPDVVDADGSWLALDPNESEGILSPSDGSLVATWRSFFQESDAVVLRAPHSFRIPWNPELERAFDAEFVRVGPMNVAVYRRR